MEWITIILSSLLGLFSPTGWGIERVAEQAIRSQVAEVETLAIRIDNSPSYRYAQGKVDRVRLSGRGIFPIAGVRIALLELETDDIVIDLASLRQGLPTLEQPLNAGVRLVLTEQDLNRALQSPEVTKQIQDLSLNLLGASTQQLERYDLVNPQVEFLDQRLRFRVALQSQQSNLQTTIELESGIQINQGKQLQLVEPSAKIDGQPVPSQFITLLVSGISQQLDLSNLAEQGITARVLNWEINPEELHLAAFVRVEPEAIRPASPDLESSGVPASNLPLH